MKTEQIFSTKERIEILKEIINKTNNIKANSVAAKLNLSKGLVSKYFDILSKEHILNKSKKGVFVADSSMVKAVRILLNIRDIDIRMFKKYSFIKSVGLYGSCAKGENTEDSDIDIWIRIKETNEEELASLTSKLKKKLSSAKLLFLTDKKIEKLIKEDALFYNALTFGSIILYGDKDGIQI